ncbi:GTP 3',8-cyclase MoaA [uncultured Cohaesibacter sp.]|uniref:GTP 3',8-cyclase MoaA n=1 Tax=uncultured Cohaesibacter sp. TaxID=1002546 RepID=UPI0029C7869C|nr:GTP 3',8-cyclase MoaA [uncultured Cohaesibacter sp.]
MSCIDPHGRSIDYVRLSLTDRCNMRCFYCLPEGSHHFLPKDHWLNFDEIERVMAAFAALGVSRIRLTGGEPLARKGVAEIAARLAALDGITDLSLSTNGALLSRFAPALFEAGVTRLNISLDSLDAANFARITGGSSLQSVLDGLSLAQTTGFRPIKINMLVMKGINDHEVVDMARFSLANGYTLRFIETMPMGEGGKAASQRYLSLDVVRDLLEKSFDLLPGVVPGGGPARYLRVRGSEGCLGFITPLSRHFCESCNRVRLGPDGTLHLCLGNSHSMPLRPHLRQGISDDGLKALILEALTLKPWKHDFLGTAEAIERPMAATGG